MAHRISRGDSVIIGVIAFLIAAVVLAIFWIRSTFLFGQVIFVHLTREDHRKIYTMNNVISIENLTKTSRLVDDQNPVLSPDGTRILFVSNRDGRNAYYVMNADGSEQTYLTDAGAKSFYCGRNYPCWDGSWSPDGTQVAFSRNESLSETRDIYMINADGSELINLTKTSKASYIHPVWSPDGMQILFNNLPDENEEMGIYAINTDGSGQSQIATLSRYYDLRWSPGNARFAFVDGNEIYLMNADGSGTINLTNNAADDKNPVWSPDGKHILFASNRDGEQEDLYIVNTDSSQLIRITQTMGGRRDFECAAWSPDSTKIASILTYDYGPIIRMVAVMNVDGSWLGSFYQTNGYCPVVWRP